jgi:hypothetical protein
MMGAWRYLAVVGVVVLLALPGCGDGDEGTTVQSTSGPTKAEFLKQAKAICEKGTDRIDTLYTRASQHVPKNDPEEHFMNEAVARFVIPIRREELRKIEALGLPREDGRSMEEFLEALEEGIKRGEESHASLRASGGEEYAFQRAYTLAGHGVLGSCFRG